jgi:hypothetical protein
MCGIDSDGEASRFGSCFLGSESCICASPAPLPPLTRLSRPISNRIYVNDFALYVNVLPSQRIMTDMKKTVLLVGGGAVGAIAAVNLEVGGHATVTVVLRSNYNIVKDKGYNIKSCDHGTLKGWRPSVGKLSYIRYSFGSQIEIRNQFVTRYPILSKRT